MLKNAIMDPPGIITGGANTRQQRGSKGSARALNPSAASSKAAASAIGLLVAITLLLIAYIYQYENNVTSLSEIKEIERVSPVDENIVAQEAAMSSSDTPRHLMIHAPIYENPRSFRRGQLKEDAVIVFIHVPKTGGASITDNIKRSPASMKYFIHRMGGRKAWKSGKAYIDQYFSIPTSTIGERKQSVFLEIHTLSPSFMNMLDLLQAWRTSAKENGMELFVFTALREPVSWALSAFNYSHRQKVSELREKNSNATTINVALRDLAQENPQCSFLAHSWMYGKPQQSRWLPNDEDYDLLLDAMKRHVDFVGTTEHHQDTVEMLIYLLGLPNNFTFIHENSAGNINDSSIRYNEMTSGTIQFHKNISLLDYKLYEDIQSEWKLGYS